MTLVTGDDKTDSNMDKPNTPISERLREDVDDRADEPERAAKGERAGEARGIPKIGEDKANSGMANRRNISIRIGRRGGKAKTRNEHRSITHSWKRSHRRQVQRTP